MTKYKVFQQEGKFGTQELVAENLSATAAQKLVFELATKEASYHNGDWQYSFESNSRSIYFHSNDRHGVKKELVGRKGDEKIELRGFSFWMEA